MNRNGADRVAAGQWIVLNNGSYFCKVVGTRDGDLLVSHYSRERYFTVKPEDCHFLESTSNTETLSANGLYCPQCLKMTEHHYDNQAWAVCNSCGVQHLGPAVLVV